MTFIVPLEQQPIRARLDASQQPTAIIWGGKEYVIEEITNFYRVPDGTLEAPIWREYFEVTLIVGWWGLIYHDLLEGGWGLEILYD